MKKLPILLAFILGILCTALFAGHFPSSASAQTPAAPTGFSFSEIRFDESMGTKKPTPQIPKSWRFIGVSNGEKTNSNNLWFQDAVGNIYLVKGFNSQGSLVLRQDIEKLQSSQQ